MAAYSLELSTIFDPSSKYQVDQENYNPNNSCITSATNYLSSTLEYISGPVTTYTLINNKTGVKIFLFGDKHNRITNLLGNSLTNQYNTVYLPDLLYILPQINNHITYEYFFELNPSEALEPDYYMYISNSVLLDNCQKIIKKLLYSDIYYDNLKINYIDIREISFDTYNTHYDKLMVYHNELSAKMHKKYTSFDFKNQEYLDLIIKYLLFDDIHELPNKIISLIQTKYDISNIQINLDIMLEYLDHDLDYNKIKTDMYNFCFGDINITPVIIYYYIIYFVICMDYICVSKISRVQDNTHVFIVAGDQHITNYKNILMHLDYSIVYEQVNPELRCPGFDKNIYLDNRSKL